jgi:hypothetical protein
MGMKGDELLKQVHAQVPNALNIMLGGQADIEAVARSIEHAKLYRFIAKPWRSEDLILTVKKALDSYECDRELDLQAQEIQILNAELIRTNQTLETTVNDRTFQIQVTVEELKILSQLKDDFLHAVFHDLQPPFNDTDRCLTNSPCLRKRHLERLHTQSSRHPNLSNRSSTERSEFCAIRDTGIVSVSACLNAMRGARPGQNDR